MAQNNGVVTGIGQGAAQVFGRTNTAQAYKDRAAFQQKQAADKKKAAKDAYGDLETPDPGEIFDNDVSGWINRENEYINKATDYAYKGVDYSTPMPDDPNSVNAYQDMYKSKRKLGADATMLKQQKKAYDNAINNINNKGSIYKSSENLDILRNWRYDLTPEERMEQGFPKLQLKENFNDPNKYLVNVPIPEVKNQIENGAVTIATKGADKGALDQSWMDFTATNYGRNFVDEFFDGDEDKAKGFYTNYIINKAGREYSRTEDEAKKDMGLGWDALSNFEMVDAGETEFASYTDEKGATVATKGKVIQTPKFVEDVALEDKSGSRNKNWSVEGFGYDGKGKPYIMASYNDGKDNIITKQLPATQSNVSAVRNAISNPQQKESFDKFNERWKQGETTLEKGTVDQDKIEGVQLVLEDTFSNADLTELNDEQMVDEVKRALSDVYSEEELNNINIDVDLSNWLERAVGRDNTFNINGKEFKVVERGGKKVLEDPAGFSEAIFNATKEKFVNWDKNKYNTSELPDLP